LKLMNQYFELKGIKAHLADSLSPLGKAWLEFRSKWNVRED
jgi:hypothetical protein